MALELTNPASLASRLNKAPKEASTADALHIRDVQDMRVLYIDENVSQLEFIQQLLNSSNLGNILSHCNCAEALARLSQETYEGRCLIDVVLLDADSKKQDSLAFCRDLHSCREWSEIPVVLLIDGDSVDESSVLAYQSTAVSDVILKPFRPAELVPRVVSALRLKRERDQRRTRNDFAEAEISRHMEMEARLQHLVDHDDLTGLHNRRFLEHSLEAAVEICENQGHSSALFYFDLDQFKVINTAEGHAAGDGLLRMIANEVQQQINRDDVFTRISSDDFALLIHNLSATDAMEFAELLRQTLNKLQVRIDTRCYDVSVSIGIAMISPEESVTASDLLARADQACFIAKNHGRNTVHMFQHEEPEFQAIQDNVYWAPKIRDALAADDFILLFQPVYDITRRCVDRYEALLRLPDGNGDLHAPALIIEVAERMGLIHDIDHWVVTRAIETLGALIDEPTVCLNINLSGHAFQNDHLPELIRQLLEDNQVDGRRITFEITETAAIANFDHTRDMIMDIRKFGCRFALDDFGSGFNSYNYLKNLPVDCLKLDGSFVANVVNDPVDQVLVRSMTQIAQTLGKRTVAECVENRETLDMLRSLGVNYAQGFYIGTPDTLLATMVPDCAKD